MKILIVVFMVLIAAATGLYFSMSGNIKFDSNADMLQMGEFALQEQRFEDAFTWYENAAYQELSEGRYQLSKLYASGQGTEQSDALAAHWMKLAAQQGLSKAEYEYGLMLEFGRGKQKAKPSEVFSWYQKAAKKGQAEAMLKVAQFLADGIGVHHNDKEALQWALKAQAAGAKNTAVLIQKIVAGITKKAGKGDAQAQYLLSEMLMQGTGVEKDKVQAIKWAQKAAELGQTEAQLIIAKHLMTEGKTSDAIHWAKKASQQGLIPAGYAYAAMLANTSAGETQAKDTWRWLYHGAQHEDKESLYNLSTCLIHQFLALPKNDVNVENWLTTSARAGLTAAQNDLGIYLLLGKKDVRNATKWLTVAAADDYRAQYNLGLIYARGDGISPDDEQAIRWWKKAEQNGGDPANLMLGMMNHLGKGVSRNAFDALLWYKRAAALGDNTAIYNTAMIYYLGTLSKPDYELAAENFLILAEKDDPIAQNIYGTMLINRELDVYDPEEGLMWLLRSARKGYLQAMFNVATVYRAGNGTSQDDKKAFYWYQKAAEENFAPAQNALGYMYVEGRGIKKDVDLARIWFQKASDNGLAIAANNLKSMKPNASFSLITLLVDTSIRSEILTDKKYDVSGLFETHKQPIF